MIDDLRARHRLCALLGELILRGPVPDAVAIARELPALGFDGDVDPGSHHSAVVGALPWESAWTSPDGQLGGEVATSVRAAYAEGGFHPGLREEPDHLGLELAYLGHLCGAEAEALADGVDPAPIRALSRSFVDRHLGRWLPAYARLVRDPPWTEVVGLAGELVSTPVQPWALSGRLPDLSDPELGLGGIARALVTPARSGWMPDAAAFARLGAAAAVPSGFGDRVGRMLVLLRSAGAAGRLDVLGQALDVELAAVSDELPGTPWATSADAARAWVSDLRRRSPPAS